MLRAVAAGVLAAATLAAPAAAAPAPGSYDTAFSGDGRVTADFGATDDQAAAVAVQPDGRIVVAGTSVERAANLQRIAVARFTAGGALDSTFSGDGRAILALDAEAIGTEVLVQPDGRILVGGRLYGQENYVLARWLPNGALDTSFGGGAGHVLGGGTTTGFDDLELQPDGRILVAGSQQMTAGRFGEYLDRRLANGAPDPSWKGPIGHVEYGWSGGAMAQRANGRIVLDQATLQQLLPDGGPDPSFGGGDGEAPEAGLGSRDLLVQPDNRLLGSGTHYVGTDEDTLDALVTRRLAGGAVDAAFGGGDGRVTFDFSTNDSTSGVELQSNGRIVAAIGSLDAVGWRVARLTASGQPDPTFGPGGIRAMAFPGAAEAFPYATAMTADGKVVVAGAAGTAGTTRGGDFAVVRLWGDPVPACAGKRPTVAAGEALVIGSDRPDVVSGGPGPERVLGLRGNDVLCGGDGADTLDGGAGSDFLYGQAGDDWLLGGLDGDRLDGGAGTDRGDGGAGSDTAVATESLTNVP